MDHVTYDLNNHLNYLDKLPTLSEHEMDQRLTDKAFEIIGELESDNLDNPAFESIGQDDEVNKALVKFIRFYNDSEKLSVKDMAYNHKIASDVIGAIVEYVKQSLEV